MPEPRLHSLRPAPAIVSEPLVLGRCRSPRGSFWPRWPATPAWRTGWRSGSAAVSVWPRPTWSMPGRCSKAGGRSSFPRPARATGRCRSSSTAASSPRCEQAARWVEGQGATAVDINMGCPVRKVVRTGGGSALMCQMERAVELVRGGGRRRVDSGHGEDEARLGRRVADGAGPGACLRAGRSIAAVIVHGRTRQQGFKGHVNRAGIRAVVEAVDRIPVVANGDIRTIADAAATFEETGCAAVSIGRGSLANPFIFRQLDCLEPDGRPGPRPDLRRANRPDVPPFPRPGRAPGRAPRLPSVPQDPQVVLSFHSTAEAVLPAAAQPLEPGALRGSDRRGPSRRARFPAARATTSCTCRFPPGRLTSGERHRVRRLESRRSIGSIR